ncbi:MAG: 50S ribosomal protein L6 [Elusimicrobiota bacterium]
MEKKQVLKLSRVGKKPIIIPAGVQVSITGSEVKVKGPKGELKFAFNDKIKVSVKETEVLVETTHNDAKVRALHGLTRALINNMIIGTTQEFKKALELQGVGYRATMKSDKELELVGIFSSHPVKFEVPAGVKLLIEKNIITITGIDKYLVGETAARIRKIRPPEPYQGTGIRYVGEYIRRKVGKAVTGTAAATGGGKK